MNRHIIQTLVFIEERLVRAANRKRRRPVPDAPQPDQPEPVPKGNIVVGHERDTPWKRCSRPAPAVSLTQEEIGSHLLYFARTGAGKSVAISHLAMQWMASDRGLIVFDPDGSQSLHIIALLTRYGNAEERLIFINLDEPDWIVGLDVLRGADESSAMLLLDAIAKHWGAEFGPVVGRSIRAAVFTAALAKPNLTFGDILLLFSSRPLRNRAAKNADAASRRFWAEYGLMRPEQQRPYIEPVANRIESWLSASTVGTMLSYPGGLNFRELFAKRPDAVVVVNLATRRAPSASRLLAALLWSQIQSQLMHPDRTRPGTKPVLAICDEFQNLGSEESLMTTLAEARKYHLSLCLATQTFSRLSAAMRDTILGNCHAMFSFSSGDTSDFAKYVHFEGDPLPKSDIAAFLARQQTGQSVLIRPGVPSVAVQHLPPPREVTDGGPDAVRALIEASNRAWAVPREQAQREIAERQARLTAEDTAASAVINDAVPTAHTPPAARRAAKRPLIVPETENPDEKQTK